MKRIITCSDGTWNKPGDEEDGKPIRTNVQKIFESICNSANDGTKQIKYYDQGIGSAGSKLTRIIDGATGRGLDENILDAYKFIIWNYEQGDEIYLFGFSRGAYTARSLAGLIRTAGLVKNNNLRLINQAYAMYRNRSNSAEHPDGDVAKKFRDEHSQPEVRIKFIGVWDTVGSLGIPSFSFFNKKKYQFHDTTLSSIVDHAYHALAIDEQRKNFQPALWEQSQKVNQGDVKQVLEQVWFSGVHSNIGGGYCDEGLSDIALNWMIEKAGDVGLNFEKPYMSENIKENIHGKLYNSNTGIFSLAGKFVRPVMKVNNGFEKIHPSVFERIKKAKGYSPINIEQE
jgi:uncharacterized protein (DUF2235 family)